MAKINFVSVLLFAEQALPQVVEANIKNILKQTFTNREIVVVYNKDRKDLDEIIAQYSVENCKFIEENVNPDFLNRIQSELQGDVIFYKTCNQYEWYPRHIQIHIDQYELNKKANWLQSLIEVRDVANPNPLMNVVGWRLEKPPVQEFEVDEISITKNVVLKWENLFVENGISKVNFLKALGNGDLTREISVIKLVNSLNNMKTEIAKQLGQPIPPPEPLQPNHFPTILGNSVQFDNNQKILEEIRKLKPEEINSIIIKRTLGMGDVLMTEPIRRYLKNIYPHAKISLMCSNSRGVYDLAKYIGYDDIILMQNENELTQDALMKELKVEELIEKEDGVLDVGEKILYSYKDYQVKIDLDMSYESRPGMPYVMSYFHTIGVDSEQLKMEDRLYKIYYDKEVEKNPKGFIMYRNGSGWPGRTWEDEKYDWIKDKLTQDGYTVTEIKDMLGIEELFDLIKSNSYYIGPDTGIMHICLCFGLETFVISGASLGEVAAYPYTITGKVIAIHADEKELPCLGCKHKMFIEMLQNQQITFVAPCKNQNGPICMKGIKPEVIYPILQQNLNKPPITIPTEENK